MTRLLRVLIVEDRKGRQDALVSLCRNHAWVLAKNCARAKRLLDGFQFDLVFLDYDLGRGSPNGSEVARHIANSPSRDAQVVVHSTNAAGRRRIVDLLPCASPVPYTRLTRNNSLFRKLRDAIDEQGVDFDWSLLTCAK